MGTWLKYSENQSGNIAVFTAILAVPMLLIMSAALDSQRVSGNITEIQNALDASALAAVSSGALEPEARIAFGKEFFAKNYNGNADLTLSVSSTDDFFTIQAKGGLSTLFSGIVGKDKIDIEKSATAGIFREIVTCLLILSKEDEQALYFKGHASFNSPNCAIQVNSKHPQAFRNDSALTPKAADICVTGGVDGKFNHDVNTECRPVDDPYKDKVLPDPGYCEKIADVTLDAPIRVARHHRTDVLVNHQTDGYVVLKPGHYCGGIELNDDVFLSPGIYHISDGPLVFGRQSKVKGDDVTFILRGKEARLHMLEQVQLSLTGSHDGDLGGLVFYQQPSGAVFPQSESVIRAGTDVSVNGVFYFPEGDLRLVGSSSLGATAEATSFIANTLSLEGNTKFLLSVDHRAAGLPPLLPRTEEGARLMSGN